MGCKDEEHLMKTNTSIQGSWSSDATVHAGDPLAGGNPQDLPCLGTCMSRQGCDDLPKQRKSTIPRARMIFMNASLPKLEHFNKPIFQEG
jgi:hypothetical protein